MSDKESERTIEMSAVRIDGDTQPRTTINPGIVQEYAEAMEAGVEFPPITVVHDGAAHWLVDGFHRFFAHRRLSRQQIKAEVITGELTEARWLSLAANKAHGLRRTNEDKTKAVMRAMKMKPELSNRAIAEHVGVGETMVRRYREILEQQNAATSSGAPKAHLEQVGVSGAEFPHLAGCAGRNGKRYPARQAQRSATQRKNGVAKSAFQPVRGHSNPQPMRALSLPHDPVMGARTLIELFDTTYLRALVAFLTQHLKGATP